MLELAPAAEVELVSAISAAGEHGELVVRSPRVFALSAEVCERFEQVVGHPPKVTISTKRAFT